MSSVFALLNKYDAATFQKGDIISANDISVSFGDKIRNNPKFHIIEVTGVTLDEAVSLLQPMMNNLDAGQEVVYARNITVDVDLMLSYEVVTKEFFLANITTKVMPEVEQEVEVVV